MKKNVNDSNKRDVELIQSIGENIGYGHMMSIASALWRKSMTDKGYPTSGVFVPTCESFIKDDCLDTLEGEVIYDNMVKKYAK